MFCACLRFFGAIVPGRVLSGCLGQSQCHIGVLVLGGLGLLKAQPPSPADPSRDAVDTYLVIIHEVAWEAPNPNLVVARLGSGVFLLLAGLRPEFLALDVSRRVLLSRLGRKRP